MTDTSQEPWDLMAAGQYERAIETFAQLYATEEPERYFAGRGVALLLSGDPASALKDFQLLASRKDPRYLADVDFIFPGICHWYLDGPSQALDCWRQAIGAPYADAAGGVTAPALLLYAGERLHDRGMSKQALQLLRRHWRNWQARLRRRESGAHLAHADFVREGLAAWPGVIVPFLLGLAQIVDVRRSVRDARHPALRRHWECEAEFYIAVWSLARGDRIGFREGMTKCSGIGEGISDFQYHLARWEVQRGFPEPAFAQPHAAD